MGFFDLFKKKENSYSNCKVCNEQILPEFEICYSCKLKDGSQNSVNNNNTREVKLYHDNGELKTHGNVDNDNKPHGNIKEWFSNGVLFKDHNFNHGVPHGSCKTFHENGNIFQDYNFEYGVEHGVMNQYYENGGKDIIATFKNGKEHGLKEQFYPSGKLETRANFVDGLIEGVHIYLSEDGEVIEEKIMQKGLDISQEIMGLMMGNNMEHMNKANIIKDGEQVLEPGEFSQKMYDYYKSNNLHVDSAHVSALNSLLEDGKIDEDFYNLSMGGLGQIDIDEEALKEKMIKKRSNS